MSVLVFVLMVTLFVVWRARRARRVTRLSGTVADRPVFSVEPPRRRMGKLGDEVL